MSALTDLLIIFSLPFWLSATTIIFLIMVIQAAPALGLRFFRLKDNFKQSKIFKIILKLSAMIGLYLGFFPATAIGVMLSEADNLAAYAVGYASFIFFESLFALIWISIATTFSYIILSIFLKKCDYAQTT